MFAGLANEPVETTIQNDTVRSSSKAALVLDNKRPPGASQSEHGLRGDIFAMKGRTYFCSLIIYSDISIR